LLSFGLNAFLSRLPDGNLKALRFLLQVDVSFPAALMKGLGCRAESWWEWYDARSVDRG
jgi:hypothetical protein